MHAEYKDCAACDKCDKCINDCMCYIAYIHIFIKNKRLKVYSFYDSIIKIYRFLLLWDNDIYAVQRSLILLNIHILNLYLYIRK